MKMRQELGLQQKLRLTQQLRQSLRLLQLSTLSLKAELQLALEKNIMLEEEGPDAEASPEDEVTAEAQEADAEEDAEPVQELAGLPEDLPVDAAWEDVYSDYKAAPAGTAALAMDTLRAKNESLPEYLLSQLNLLDLTPRQRFIALYLLDALDDNGYLSETLPALCESMDQSGQIENPQPDEFAEVLRIIQTLDPAGVGARDPKECLLLQLQQQPLQTPGHADAIWLVEYHLTELPTLADTNGLGPEWDQGRLEQARRLIRSLNPHPGDQIGGPRTDYVTPDVYVTKKAARWVVALNQEALPRLRINAQYLPLAQGRGSCANHLKKDLQEARWLLRSVNERNRQLLRVANSVVYRQRAFLEHGEEQMKPLVLGDIAAELLINESTVSRTIAGKYIHSPQGLHELKFFFSSSLDGKDKRHSSTAVRAMIRKLIDHEPPQKPLNDSRLADALGGHGIKVARRTVAKYRKAMGIPPCHERRNVARHL